jgi:small subunit ribosomal protein S5
MAGLESLRTPEEVAALRGLSVNAVLGLVPEEKANETISADEPVNGTTDAEQVNGTVGAEESGEAEVAV